MIKKIIIALLILLVVVGIVGFIVLQNINQGMAALDAAEIPQIDLSQVEDGSYDGDYKATPIDVEVRVTVSNHQIADIALLKHTNGQGAPAETIIGSVVEAQTLQVDAVSGATYSSKAILLAISDALNIEVHR
ncbi:MAG TPA: FMN-binding protein [Clostridiales bacterium]|nr:FMN-binding protein [Clostridiales bacterium]